MKYLLLGLCVALLFVCPPATADSYVVIVNEENSVKGNGVKFFKLRVRSWPDGEEVEPAEIKVDGDLEKGLIQHAFVTQYLNVQSVAEYREYWLREKSKGKTKRPAEKRSFKAVLKHVRREIGGIGYVPRSMAEKASGIRILGEFNP